MQRAISSGKFREDLFYRLNTVPVNLPALRNRKDDIHLIFRKFAHDFAEKYRMPAIKLTEDAVHLLLQYSWPGNVRQLRNFVEQLSVIETSRELDAAILHNYLPEEKERVPTVMGSEQAADQFSEREIMYKILFDMKKDLSDLKKLVVELIGQGGDFSLNPDQSATVNRFYQEIHSPFTNSRVLGTGLPVETPSFSAEEPIDAFEEHIEVEESLSLEDREKDLIQKALTKHRGKRKYAAAELGISERTLYRKIKEFNLLD
jgi:transcriptional regulator with PAS, ATPase and Fis domain